MYLVHDFSHKWSCGSSTFHCPAKAASTKQSMVKWCEGFKVIPFVHVLRTDRSKRTLFSGSLCLDSVPPRLERMSCGVYHSRTCLLTFDLLLCRFDVDDCLLGELGEKNTTRREQHVPGSFETRYQGRS